MISPFALSDTTTDFSEFVNQFNAALSAKGTWQGTLTTQTSQTLVQLISTIGTFDNAKLLRYYEDSFSDTAQSDGAIRAIAVMQGIRLTRKLPAGVPVVITATADLTLNAYAQFNVNGQYFFNRDQINLVAGVAQEVTLYQGQVKGVQLTGLGTNLQVFMSQDSDFTVSDQDVMVAINQSIIPKAYGGLWNYKGSPAYSDLTHSDGRLMLQFGSTTYGTVPQVNDTISILYVVTNGEDGNAMTTVNGPVVLVGSTLISGTAVANPTGGGNQKDTLAYKNVEAGAFGTYASAVTRDQYRAVVNTYPGIVDAITQAQREINPMKKEWMNTIRVSALTSSPWTQEQKKAFCEFIQAHTLYSPYVLWQDALAVQRDVDIEVYCYNTAIPSLVEAQVAEAANLMFAPHPGLLQTNFYPSDLDAVARKAAPGAVSYVKINSPLADMIVTAPPSPSISSEVLIGGGVLTPLVYAYGISTIMPDGEGGPPTNWTFPQVINGFVAGVKLNWLPVAGAASYRIWGRKAGSIGLLTTVDSSVTTWTDDGKSNPTGEPPNTLSELPIRYNSLRSLRVKAYFASRQQRFSN